MASLPSVSYFLGCLLIFLWLIHPGSPIKCYKCGKDCSQNNVPLVQCPKKVTQCVTSEIDRYRIERSCYSGIPCSVQNLASLRCQLCNTDGCNMKAQEPLICRSCDWTHETECPVRKRCHIPYGTQHVFCYILYSRMQGFHYGCFHEAPAEVEFMMFNDFHQMLHHRCDGHDCNRVVDFLPKTGMFDSYRMCFGCDQGMCGHILCPNPYHKYGMFCYRDHLRQESGCMSNLTDVEVKAGFKGREFLYCAENWCNENQDKNEVKLVCNDQEGYGRYCPTTRGRCVSYKDDSSKTYLPLGCSDHVPCFDKERCFFCDRHGCNEKKLPNIKHTLCYACSDVDGPACLRVRDVQTLYLTYCYKTGCRWTWNEKLNRQSRGCAGEPVTEEGYTSVDCITNYCNQFPTTAVCYDCQENNRDCVYSQTHMNMVSCRAGVPSCFIHDRGDGRVQRGCGVREGEGAINCHNSTLCNEESTVQHACHIFETDFDFEMKIKPPVVTTQFSMGWTPDVCSDIDGRPACYMSYHTTGMVWGCMGDLKHYKEWYYGAEASDTFLPCEGHYCNYLP